MSIEKTRRWDLLVRLTHWGVAAGVLANAVFTEAGSEAHEMVGYGVAGLLVIRWVWGLVGSREARFAAFPPSPARALAHTRDIIAGRPAEHRSHNPLGALMVYALWATLAVVIATGVAMEARPANAVGADVGVAADPSPAGSRVTRTSHRHEDRKDEDDHGDAGRDTNSAYADYDRDGEREEGLMGEIHEGAANLLFVLAGLHVLGVAFETRRSGRQILTAMGLGPKSKTART